ncbi:SDR family NAD(P)-dependent oxidoreductase [Kaistia geumhonensis]|uniref:NAD(P)-dependent dehydrogenase (Short-subunit alcohol dehydrogenase family) n=1 Tax=Kaistia geumhonensis TaxID=410839 RepID=A0ABU0M2J4_9HYPH|nr:SDR family NAD(P)-dependent oxidoreductase [Kaistia geumhonensis]MCX5479603.1 SDR family NAD(P)-dependent oxidoreductase [Kaistia geumhonensis]MDQ0515174.1 NAD(P)-dependent dehydrogenase (short-subunit alcohol dehydrogenase family) [Kaistia geumhonensis]
MLNGQVALITGAAHPAGIGFAIARTLLAAGAAVTIVDLGQEACDAAARSLTAALSEKGTRHEPPLAMAADVRDRAALESVVAKTVERFGGLDVLVSNAGIAQPRKIMDISDEDWSATLDINLRGMLNLTQAALPHLADSGRIVAIASIAAQRGGGLLGGPHYAASKGGVLSLAKSMAREFGPRGIRVNCVNPGVIITGMNATAFDDATRQRLLDQIPLGRFGTPQDVADVCLFLASAQSGYLTGTAIDINGGMHIH